MARTFDWDPLKARINVRKHGVSFEEAASAVLDPLSEVTLDYRQSYEESRYIAFETSWRRRLLVVSNTQRGTLIRLISARLATRRERKIYEEYQAKPR